MGGGGLGIYEVVLVLSISYLQAGGQRTHTFIANGGNPDYRALLDITAALYQKKKARRPRSPLCS